MSSKVTDKQCRRYDAHTADTGLTAETSINSQIVEKWTRTRPNR